MNSIRHSIIKSGRIYLFTDYNRLTIIIIIIAEMTVFNVAGYLIEERRRWPVITASPRGQYSKQIQNFERNAHSDEKTVPVAWLD